MIHFVDFASILQKSVWLFVIKKLLVSLGPFKKLSSVVQFAVVVGVARLHDRYATLRRR